MHMYVNILQQHTLKKIYWSCAYRSGKHFTTLFIVNFLDGYTVACLPNLSACWFLYQFSMHTGLSMINLSTHHMLTVSPTTSLTSLLSSTIVSSSTPESWSTIQSLSSSTVSISQTAPSAMSVAPSSTPNLGSHQAINL